MKTDFRKIMLGLYLMGMRWVGLDVYGYYAAYEEKPEQISGVYIIEGGKFVFTDDNEMLNDAVNEYLNALPQEDSPYIFEILPWLETNYNQALQTIVCA